MTVPAKLPKTFAPTLAFVRNLPEAGPPIRRYAEHEAEIIARVTSAMADAERDLSFLRRQAEEAVGGRWTPEEIAEAKAAKP